MLILMKADASQEDVAAVEKNVRELGFVPNKIPGATRMAIGITGNQGAARPGAVHRSCRASPRRSRSRSPGSWSRAR